MLQAKGIDKRFGGMHALKNVDFELREGEVHALLGENGAGKSTLIKILSGVITADCGSIAVGDQPVNIGSVAHAQLLGIRTVHQELELAGPLSVAENLCMGDPPRRWGVIDSRAMHRSAAAGIAEIGAEIDPEARVDSLSVGDRQVVEITRAIMKKARVLILDEPTAALPPREVDRLHEVIRRLKRAGAGIIYVSHRLDEVLSIADRMTVLRDGKVVSRLLRGDVDRADLVRHILGKELSEFRSEPIQVDDEAETLISCFHLSSGPELADISFRLRKGEVLGFFGLLGAGQGVIADALIGLRHAKADACNIDGDSDLPRNPRGARQRGLAYIPSDRKNIGLALGLSVLDNLIMPDLGKVSRYGVLSRSRARARAHESVTDYGIRCASIDEPAGNLSGGNQQKVSVAKWAGSNARIMVFDEPTRGVDVGARVEIYHFIRAFAANGGGVLVASSDPAEIRDVCDRAIVMRGGRISAELAANQLDERALLSSAL